MSVQEHGTRFRDEQNVFPEDVNPGSAKVTTRTIRKKYGAVNAWLDKGKRSTIADKYARPDAIELHRTKPMAAIAHQGQERIGYPAESKRMDGASAVARLRTRVIGFTTLALWSALSFSVSDRNPLEINGLPTPADASQLPGRAFNAVFDRQGSSTSSQPNTSSEEAAAETTTEVVLSVPSTAPPVSENPGTVGDIPPVVNPEATLAETAQTAAVQIGGLACDTWSFGTTTPEGQDPTDDNVPVIAIGNLNGEPVASLNPQVAQAFYDTIVQKNAAEGIALGQSITVGTELWYPANCNSADWQALGLVD